MFRRAAGLLDFGPADGQQVELRGRLAVYEPRGELQFVVEACSAPVPAALYEQFLRLKARLEAAGPVRCAAQAAASPAHPRRIGVVTSLGAAALHDVLTALARRAPQVRSSSTRAWCRGPMHRRAGAGPGDHGNRSAPRSTRCCWCRGGGSLEDLWAFNDEARGAGRGRQLDAGGLRRGP
jgi:exodeoxyribonuclease VII large subunit